MSLRFLGGDTGGGGSPRLYQDGDDYLVQGYAVAESELLAELSIPDGEAVVRVPRSLWNYLPAESRVNLPAEESPAEENTEESAEESTGQVRAGRGNAESYPEMRDLYAVEEEDAQGGACQAESSGLAVDEASRRRWLELMSATAGRPAVAWRNQAARAPGAGRDWSEESLGMAPRGLIRLLLRDAASSLVAPGNSLRVIGGTTTIINHFSRDGSWVGSVMIDDMAQAWQCTSAFDAAWEISARHGQGRRA